MKKAAALFLAVFTLLFGACSVQRYSDAAMFCRRFNSEYKNSLLDIEDACVAEADGCTVFRLMPEKSILISLFTDSDGVKIKRISITAHGSVGDMQKGLFGRFLALCKCAVPAYSNGSDTQSRQIRDRRDSIHAWRLSKLLLFGGFRRRVLLHGKQKSVPGKRRAPDSPQRRHRPEKLTCGLILLLSYMQYPACR